MSNVGDDLRKVLLAGVGAVAVLAEKSKELVGELSEKGGKLMEDAQPKLDELEQKGSEALKQGKILGDEVVAKFKSALNDARDAAEQMDLASIEASLAGLSDEAIAALREMVEAELAQRQADSVEDPVHRPDDWSQE